MKIDEKIVKINGHELLLRVATEEDASMLLEYLKTTCGETKYLVKEPEEINLTLEEEYSFIRNQNEAEHNLMLLGFLDGTYVGNCSFMGMGPKRYQHRVSMGIALYQNYIGMGIGSVMIGELCKLAKEIGMEQMELEVVSTNMRAISLYTKMGFKIFGTFPNNMKYKDGTYADVYWMMKQL